MHIIGAGGHGKVIAEALTLGGVHSFCFIDDDRLKMELLKMPIKHCFPEHVNAAVIAIGNNLTRKRIASTYTYTYWHGGCGDTRRKDW